MVALVVMVTLVVVTPDGVAVGWRVGWTVDWLPWPSPAGRPAKTPMNSVAPTCGLNMMTVNINVKRLKCSTLYCDIRVDCLIMTVAIDYLQSSN